MRAEPADHLKNASLQRMRGFAVVIVAYYHFWLSLKDQIPRFPGSPAGVDLFFVISGCVVSQSLVQIYQKNLASPRSTLWDFYIRRIFRILPLALFWISVFIFCVYGFNKSGTYGSVPMAWKEVRAIALLNYNFVSWGEAWSGLHLGFFWTLMVEEHFYLLLPILLILSGRAHFFSLCLLSLICTYFLAPALILRFAAPENVSLLFHSSTFVHLPKLLLGVLIGISEKFIRQQRLNFLRKNQLAICLVAVLLICFSTQIHELTGLSDLYFSIAFLSSAILVYMSQNNPVQTFHFGPTINRIFENLGDWSYGIYLSHLPVFFFLIELSYRYHLFKEAWLGVFAAGTLTVLVSAALFHFLERPLIAVGKKLTQNRL